MFQEFPLNNKKQKKKFYMDNPREYIRTFLVAKQREDVKLKPETMTLYHIFNIKKLPK